MLRYPSQVASQNVVLAPLLSLLNQQPWCEDWITLLTKIETVWDTLSPGALQNMVNIGRVVANVLDYLHTTQTQSVYSSQYLLTLSINARTASHAASLVASTSTGTISLTLTQAAQTALSTLLAWDPVLGYQVPPNPGQLADTLVSGVSVT